MHQLKMHKITNLILKCIRSPFLGHMQAFLGLFRRLNKSVIFGHFVGIIDSTLPDFFIETFLNYYTQECNWRIFETSDNYNHRKYHR